MSEFCLDDIKSIFNSTMLLPSSEMSKKELFTTMMRLLLVITVALYLMKFQYWYVIFALGILIVITYCKNERQTGSTRPQEPSKYGEYTPMSDTYYTSTPRKSCPYQSPYNEATQITRVPTMDWKPLSVLQAFPKDYTTSYEEYNKPEPQIQMSPFAPMSAYEMNNIPYKPVHNTYNEYNKYLNCGGKDEEIKKLSTIAMDIMTDRMNESSVARDYAQLQQSTFFGSVFGRTPACY